MLERERDEILLELKRDDQRWLLAIRVRSGTQPVPDFAKPMLRRLTPLPAIATDQSAAVDEKSFISAIWYQLLPEAFGICRGR